MLRTCVTCHMLQTCCLSSTESVLWEVYYKNKFQVWESWAKVPNKSCQRLWHYKSHHNRNPLPCLNHKRTSRIQQNQTGTNVNLWLWPLRSYYLSTLPFTVAYGMLCIQQKGANLISGKFTWQQTCPYRPASTTTFHKTQPSTTQVICTENCK